MTTMASTWVSAIRSSRQRLSWRRGLAFRAAAACLVVAFSQQAMAVAWLSAADFIANSFTRPPEVRTLWLTADHQAAARSILGHAYRGLRLRYWSKGKRTAWILDEIGKERPITIGVVVDDGRVSRVDILEYRESRGGEIRHPFFTAQFAGLALEDDLDLSGNIDGITGATLSVRAVTNTTRFALYLDRYLNAHREQVATP